MSRPDELRTETTTPALEQVLLVRAALDAVGIAVWVVLCGAFAARGFDTSSTLAIAMTCLLIVGLTVVWLVIAEVAWARPVAQWRRWVIGKPLPALPYAQPGSDATNLGTTLGQFGAWMQQAFVPRYGITVLIGLAGLFVVVIAAASIGAQHVALAILALVVSQLALFAGRGEGEPHVLVRSIVLVSLPLLMGYATRSTVNAPMVCLALGLGAVFANAQTEKTEVTEVRSGTNWLRYAGYGVGIAVMVWLRQPVGAFVLAVLCLAQWYAPPTTARRACAWVLVSLAATAFALAL
jgi:hypothetical protein